MTDFLRGIRDLLDMAPWRIPMIAWMTLGMVLVVLVIEVLRAFL